jgi:hypothetical protein
MAMAPPFVELKAPNVVPSSAAFISRNIAEPPGLSKIFGVIQNREREFFDTDYRPEDYSSPSRTADRPTRTRSDSDSTVSQQPHFLSAAAGSRRKRRARCLGSLTFPNTLPAGMKTAPEGVSGGRFT